MFCGGGSKFKDTQILDKKFKRVQLGESYFKGEKVVLVDSTKEGTGNLQISKEQESRQVLEELKRLRASVKTLDEKIDTAKGQKIHYSNQIEVLKDLIVAKQMDIEYYKNLEKGDIPDDEFDLMTVDTLEETN